MLELLAKPRRSCEHLGLAGPRSRERFELLPTGLIVEQPEEVVVRANRAAAGD